MADDWIRMRTDLVRDPKLLRMAKRLAEGELSNVTRNVTRNAAVGAVLAIWGNARRNGRMLDESPDDLLLAGAELADLDDVSELPGTGDAMAFAGWVVEDASGLIFPGFFADYNTPVGANYREKNRERQRRFRERKRTGNRNVTRNALRNVTVTDRGEERREESNTNDSVVFQSVVDEFVKTTGRRARLTANRRKALTARFADAFFRENWREAMAVAQRSPFCTGTNDRNWVWTLDFFLRPDSVTKLMEGQFDGGSNAKTNGTGRTNGVERTLGDIADWISEGTDGGAESRDRIGTRTPGSDEGSDASRQNDSERLGVGT